MKATRSIAAVCARLSVATALLLSACGGTPPATVADPDATVDGSVSSASVTSTAPPTPSDVVSGDSGVGGGSEAANGKPAVAPTTAKTRPDTAEPDSIGRAALVAFYNATNGDNWTNNNGWLTTAPVGEWHGVTTDPDGRVTELDLWENNLAGAIPPELGNLTHLTYLYLDENRLTGTIPSELGNLSSLTVLSLFGNELAGAIPPELGNLTSLTGLILWGNDLSECVPGGLRDQLNMSESDLGDLPFCS